MEFGRYGGSRLIQAGKVLEIEALRQIRLRGYLIRHQPSLHEDAHNVAVRNGLKTPLRWFPDLQAWRERPVRLFGVECKATLDKETGNRSIQDEAMQAYTYLEDMGYSILFVFGLVYTDQPMRMGSSLTAAWLPDVVKHSRGPFSGKGTKGSGTDFHLFPQEYEKTLSELLLA